MRLMCWRHSAAMEPMYYYCFALLQFHMAGVRGWLGFCYSWSRGRLSYTLTNSYSKLWSTIKCAGEIARKLVQHQTRQRTSKGHEDATSCLRYVRY